MEYLSLSLCLYGLDVHPFFSLYTHMYMHIYTHRNGQKKKEQKRASSLRSKEAARIERDTHVYI